MFILRKKTMWRLRSELIMKHSRTLSSRISQDQGSRGQKNGIRTSDETYQKKLEEIHGVNMTSNDNDYYNDNCFGRYIATCERKVCKAWKKTEERKEKRRKTEEEKREREIEKNRESEERKSQYLKEQVEINVTLEEEEYVPPQIIPQEKDKIQTTS